MKQIFILTALFIITFFGNDLLSDSLYFPGKNWKYANSLQLENWSKEKLYKAKKYWEELGSTSVMIVENGYIIQEWGDSKIKVQCNSLRKSFLSALYGIFIEKGVIKLSSSLEQLEIDDKIPRLSKIEKQATIRDLLKSKSGIYHSAAYETKKMKAKRPRRHSYMPGVHWYYNNWDFNTLGSIFKKLTSLTVFDAFNRFISNPLQMQDFSLNDTKFIYDKSSIHPAYTFRISTRDRARFGLLFLNEGKWKNRQIISKKWIEESTTSYTTVGNGVGYGYMWWVSINGWHLGNKFKGKSFSARGSGGQYIVIIPSKKLVIVQSVDKKSGDKISNGKSFNKLLKLVIDAKVN